MDSDNCPQANGSQTPSSSSTLHLPVLGDLQLNVPTRSFRAPISPPVQAIAPPSLMGLHVLRGQAQESPGPCLTPPIHTAGNAVPPPPEHVTLHLLLLPGSGPQKSLLRALLEFHLEGDKRSQSTALSSRQPQPCTAPCPGPAGKGGRLSAPAGPWRSALAPSRASCLPSIRAGPWHRPCLPVHPAALRVRPGQPRRGLAAPSSAAPPPADVALLFFFFFHGWDLFLIYSIIH